MRRASIAVILATHVGCAAEQATPAQVTPAHATADHDQFAAAMPAAPPPGVADLDVRLVRALCVDAEPYQMFPHIGVVRGCCDEVCSAFHISPDGAVGPRLPHDLSIPALGESGDVRAVQAIAGKWPNDVLIASAYWTKVDDRDRLHVLHWDGARQEERFACDSPRSFPGFATWSGSTIVTQQCRRDGPIVEVSGPAPETMPEVPADGDYESDRLVALASLPGGHALLARAWGDGYARGTFARSIFAHFDGVEVLHWASGAERPQVTRFPELSLKREARDTSLPVNDIQPLWMRSPTEAYLATTSKVNREGVILRFDGARWTPSLVLEEGRSFDQFVVGADGAMWVRTDPHYGTGQIWRRDPGTVDRWTRISPSSFGDEQMRAAMMMPVGERDMLVLATVSVDAGLGVGLYRIQVPAPATTPRTDP